MSKAVEKIVIVGSGCSASITAAFLARQTFSKIKIVCIEDPKHKDSFFEPASDPFFRNFIFSFDFFEANWLLSSGGSYCLAALYEGFGNLHKRAYLPFDPLFSASFNGYSLFEHYLAGQLRGQPMQPIFNTAPYLCDFNKAPFLPGDAPYFGASGGNFGYLFDPSLAKQHFRKTAMGLGVDFYSSIVKNFAFNSDGSIKAVQTKDGDNFEADFFIDCSGSDGLIVQKALKGPFVEDGNLQGLYYEQECNNAPLEPYYTQSAMEKGLLLKWPLRNKNIFLYLYEPWRQSENEAKALFKDKDLQSLHFRLGSLERPWVKNVLAISSAAAVFDPRANLQWQHLVKSLEEFIVHFPLKDKNEQRALSYNRALYSHVEDAKSFVAAHHITQNKSLPRRLGRIFEDWKAAVIPRLNFGVLANPLNSTDALKIRSLALFAIQGVLPNQMPAALRLLEQEQIDGLKNLQASYEMAARQFPDHREFLQMTEDSLDMTNVDPGFMESKNAYDSSGIRSQTSVLKNPHD